MANSFRSNGVTFISNEDLSGDVMIRLSKPDSEGHDILRVPAEAVVAFVADIVRKRKIKKLEIMPAMQVLTEND